MSAIWKKKRAEKAELKDSLLWIGPQNENIPLDPTEYEYVCEIARSIEENSPLPEEPDWNLEKVRLYYALISSRYIVEDDEKNARATELEGYRYYRITRKGKRLLAKIGKSRWKKQEGYWAQHTTNIQNWFSIAISAAALIVAIIALVLK